jgi:hypothetical protein
MAALAAGILVSGGAGAATYTVDATDDIFLAGQTSLPSPDFAHNGAYGNGVGAGSLPVAISVTSGTTLHLIATGAVSCCSGNISNDPNGPNGGGFGGPTNILGYGNVAGVPSSLGVPDLALLGVFNGPGAAGAQLWQPFLVGASYTATVPTGVTTLYLGFADAFGFSGAPGAYNDNTGSLTVSSVPESSTWAMMALGFAGLASAAYRTRRSTVAAAL